MVMTIVRPGQREASNRHHHERHATERDQNNFVNFGAHLRTPNAAIDPLAFFGATPLYAMARIARVAFDGRVGWSFGTGLRATQIRPLFHQIGPEIFASDSAACGALDIRTPLGRNPPHPVLPLRHKRRSDTNGLR